MTGQADHHGEGLERARIHWPQDTHAEHRCARGHVLLEIDPAAGRLKLSTFPTDPAELDALQVRGLATLLAAAYARLTDDG